MFDLLSIMLPVVASIAFLFGSVAGVVTTLTALYHFRRRRLLRQCWRRLLIAWWLTGNATYLLVGIGNGRHTGVLSNDIYAAFAISLLMAGDFCFVRACMSFNREIYVGTIPGKLKP